MADGVGGEERLANGLPPIAAAYAGDLAECRRLLPISDPMAEDAEGRRSLIPIAQNGRKEILPLLYPSEAGKAANPDSWSKLLADAIRLRA